MPLRTNYRFKKSGASITTVHEKKGMDLLKEFLRWWKPELILETGTSWGGMTALFHDACPDVELHSYDRRSKSRNPHWDRFNNPTGFKKISNIHIHFCDLLADVPNEHLVEQCQSSVRKFLYLDNGNKIAEFLRYAIHLNPGDFVGVHDFGREFALNWKELNEYHQQIISPDETEAVKNRIQAEFSPYNHETFEYFGVSSRLWRKI